MRFGRCGEKVRFQVEVDSHGGSDQVLTSIPNIRSKVCLLQETPQLNGVNVMKPLGGRMRQAKHTESKTTKMKDELEKIALRY